MSRLLQLDAYVDGLNHGINVGVKAERDRIIELLKALTAYDEDGDLFLAESWPELNAYIEGESK